MPHIFISYAKKDTYALATRLRDELNAIPGVTTWMDERLKSGESWARQIEDEIDRADFVLVLLSPDVNRPATPMQARSFVLNEIDYAQQDGKTIIPVMAMRTKMPVQIAGIQYIDFSANTEAGIQKLVQDITRRAGIITPSTPDNKSAQTKASDKWQNRTVWLVVIILLMVFTGVVAVILSNLGRELDGNTFTPAPTLTVLQFASTPVARNADWTPIEQDIDGVTMVLVPVGCFDMGTTTGGYSDEQPVEQQCIEMPFWIDKYEVTQEQFNRLGGVSVIQSYWTGSNRPRENITWFEAQHYCEQKRGGRLPTEKEWEYAARGPDNLIYPWGNEFVAANADYGENSEKQTADVGSRPGGVSWVGAMDLSGNVFEWVSSLNLNYPYDATRAENLADTNSARGVRGGSSGATSPRLRASTRYGAPPIHADSGTGARCARSSS